MSDQRRLIVHLWAATDYVCLHFINLITCTCVLSTSHKSEQAVANVHVKSHIHIRQHTKERSRELLQKKTLQCLPAKTINFCMSADISGAVAMAAMSCWLADEACWSALAPAGDPGASRSAACNRSSWRERLVVFFFFASLFSPGINDTCTMHISISRNAFSI